MTERLRALTWPAVCARLHPALLVAMLALRPLIWDGQTGNLDQLVYLVLVLIGLAVCLGESWAGLRPRWRWGWAGVAFAALLLLLAPAAWRSPLVAEGVATWGSLLIHLGLAVYLMQIVPGRERLALAALGGGLAGELLICLGQRLWVLPAFAAMSEQGGLEFQLLENPHGDLADRIANGGVFGSFTLANTLAAYLLLTAPLFVAVAAQRSATPLIRTLAAALVAGAVLALVGASSKGAIAALVGAGAVLALAEGRGWRRWAPSALLALAVILALALPALRAGVRASAEVRWGYWIGAARLIGESPLTGHGLHAFAAESPRVLPLWAEPSRFVHNELLEVAVDGGLPAALALLAIAIAALRRPLPANAVDYPSTADREAAAARWSPWLLALAIPYLHVFGTIDVSSWPAGRTVVGEWGWILVTGLAMSGTVAALRGAALPAPWAWRLALAAFTAHCLVDFNLHSSQCWGTLCAVAALAGGGARRDLELRLPGRIAATIGLAALAVGLVLGARRGGELRLANELPRQVRAAQLAVKRGLPEAYSAVDGIAYLLDRPSPPALVVGDRVALDELYRAARERSAELAAHWPAADAESELAALTLAAAGAQRQAWTSAVIARHPLSALARAVAADDCAAESRFADAIVYQREAVRLAPTYLPYQQRLADLLRRGAATASGAEATAQRDEAQSIDRTVAELAPLVHFRNRPR